LKAKKGIRKGLLFYMYFLQWQISSISVSVENQEKIQLCEDQILEWRSIVHEDMFLFPNTNASYKLTTLGKAACEV
jgi:hypothetical protein